MNDDDLSAFEKELQAMRPRPPSPGLRARLDALVDARAGDRPRAQPRPPSRPRGWWWQRHGHWVAIAAGVALAVAVFLWQPFQPDPEPVAAKPAGAAAVPETSVAGLSPHNVEQSPEQRRYRPVRARNLLKNRIDEGLVTLDNGLSARRYRFQFVDTVVWEDPADGTQFEVSTPREELVLVPVHTF